MRSGNRNTRHLSGIGGTVAEEMVSTRKGELKRARDARSDTTLRLYQPLRDLMPRRRVLQKANSNPASGPLKVISVLLLPASTSIARYR